MEELMEMLECIEDNRQQRLFDKMNAGEVRILLGSTRKCGAGMNAQAKMIALHHLDCPLRPSDVEHFKRNIEKYNRTSRNILNKYTHNHIVFHFETPLLRYLSKQAHVSLFRVPVFLYIF